MSTLFFPFLLFLVLVCGKAAVIQHSPIIDRNEEVKEKILKALGLHKPPQGLHEHRRQKRIVFTDQDKVGDIILPNSTSGYCHLVDHTEISNCFLYSVNPRTPAVSAKFVLSIKPEVLGSYLTVTLYEVSRWQGEQSRLGRGEVREGEIGKVPNLHIEVFKRAKTWFNADRNTNYYSDHRVKIDVRVDNREVSYWEVFNEVPELDFSYYYRPPTSECDEDVACCLKAHYVNFTEIGWSDFILYPAGFYANYCIGPPNLSCTHENADLQGIISSAYNESPLLRQPSLCAPRTFHPITILYMLSPNHTRKRTLDNMIASSCSCHS